MPKPKQWQCTVCGYKMEGNAPPAQCPPCGAPGAKFVPFK